jgi:hypothetical protein
MRQPHHGSGTLSVGPVSAAPGTSVVHSSADSCCCMSDRMGSTIETDARTSSFLLAARTKAAAMAAAAASASPIVAAFMSTGAISAEISLQSGAGVTGRSDCEGPEGGRLPPNPIDNALLGRDRPPNESPRPPAFPNARVEGAGWSSGTLQGDNLPLEKSSEVAVSGRVINMFVCCS